MKKNIVLAFFLLMVGVAFADSWVFAYKPLVGKYAIYGGGLGEGYRPSSSDIKISLSISGEGAKDVFDSIGPDLKNVCGVVDGRVRERNGGKISCISKKSGYVCYFGFDLKTGKSIAGSIC